MGHEYIFPFLDLKAINEPYRRPMLDAMTQVVDSGRYIGGPALNQFEDMLATQTHAPFAVGVTNGLDALRLMLRAYKELGALADGDEVIVPANTYVATVLAITDNGLTPVFVEPDAVTMNLNTELIENAITPRTRAVMTVHLYGRICYDATLASVVRRHNLLLLEDNAQAIGAVANTAGLFGTNISGALGHAGAFSFYPSKNIGALGDAGAVVTHSAQLAEAIRALRNYGSLTQYNNIYRGLNCRLDPVKAAALSVKLPAAKSVGEERRKRAEIYNRLITNPLVTKPLYTDDAESVWHQYVVRVPQRNNFRRYLANNGVETAIHYATPPHRQQCYAQYAHLHLPVTDSIADTCVSLPISQATELRQIEQISNIINQWMP